MRGGNDVSLLARFHLQHGGSQGSDRVFFFVRVVAPLFVVVLQFVPRYCGENRLQF